ncbi:succinylglutamate desuccinylase/aspartoacylase domain-containing protein [Frigidibacter sp. ROC022]|uniref:succinylglutamate desuccinylase/aspartoacylase domain-containing protein n=1 Tax=Frigidibacter sp. ROC022 TaxID=2971796 RepID=UPI00215B669A|nr:succinylglutamate desuccinylase/aspartoacylase family protein [Frigidibacter sp. ROC022]MCR8725089.1 succinylglutamate desuccinylase/aspartoacylase family protein [Frigidibacter sp. ROC022]
MGNPEAGTSRIHNPIDFGKTGRQAGHLQLPPDPTTGSAGERVPIVCIANGSGPTVLVSAGNHGDEYAGQLAALRLIRDIEPAQVSGRIIVVPIISTEASRANTRLWPSGANFNRSFPGNPDGPVIEQLAHFFSAVLFPEADVVIDMHSSGRDGWIEPCSHMCVPKDPVQRKAMLEAMEMWNSDFHFFYTSAGNYLPNEAERQGKIVVTTEFGGGTRIPVAVQALAWNGLVNVLRHVGVLEGEVVTRASLGLPPPIFVDCRYDNGSVGEAVSGLMDFIKAPVAGLLEVLVETGTPVAEGQPIGRIWSHLDPTRQPVDITSPFEGYLMGMKTLPVVEQGQSLALIGRQVDRSDVLAKG